MSHTVTTDWNDPAMDMVLHLDDRDRNTQSFRETLDSVLSLIAPLWPMQDFVAVNPFQGMSDRPFLAARQSIRDVRDAEMLMPVGYYHQQLQVDAIHDDDFKTAIALCRDEYPELFENANLTPHQMRTWDAGAAQADLPSARRFYTAAELVDQHHHMGWFTIVMQEIAKVCAAHYDQGQALWPSPWKSESLYTAWRDGLAYDRRAMKLGIEGWSELVSALPARPSEAIEFLLAELGVPKSQQAGFLLCQLYSVNGWASYIQYQLRSGDSSQGDNDLVGLLAIRLAYDVALSKQLTPAEQAKLWPSDGSEASAELDSSLTVSCVDALRYLQQVTLETAYRRQLASLLLGNDNNATKSESDPHQESGSSVGAAVTPTYQMVFCIDVRSEVIRRHLELVSDRVETFGFAGFFGLPMEFVPFGQTHGSPQCPVLLEPSFKVHQRMRGANAEVEAEALENSRFAQARRSVWRLFQSSAVSCFTFVESIGVLYAATLLKKSFGLRSGQQSPSGSVDSGQPEVAFAPHIAMSGECGLSLSAQKEMAYRILKNLGLTDRFADVVAIVGHTAETCNNPYQASLDCGACGGHSGESNARVAAGLLNDVTIRQGLAERGIHIPATTWFVPAVHNTTTDQIALKDVDLVPASLQETVRSLEGIAAKAGQLARSERSSRLGTSDAGALFAKARDWSEVRPEWGLAGNAAFIVAPRSRTKGLKLDGRTFMHSYEYAKDTSLETLELIMTAPMVVANWINLQYFASSVDNKAYGSGNKVLHNVVGQFGVQQGNGGDLMTGLPWQSVHDGQSLQHQPLRLNVIIEAPRQAIQSIIDKHKVVSDLAGNGWLTVMSIEDGNLYGYSKSSGWSLWHAAASA